MKLKMKKIIPPHCVVGRRVGLKNLNRPKCTCTTYNCIYWALNTIALNCLFSYSDKSLSKKRVLNMPKIGLVFIAKGHFIADEL